MVREEVEICPECEAEVTINWDVEKDGYKVPCPECGTEMMLCDACTHSEDNPGAKCDWSKKDGCFRMHQREA